MCKVNRIKVYTIGHSQVPRRQTSNCIGSFPGKYCVHVHAVIAKLYSPHPHWCTWLYSHILGIISWEGYNWIKYLSVNTLSTQTKCRSENWFPDERVECQKCSDVSYQPWHYYGSHMSTQGNYSTDKRPLQLLVMYLHSPFLQSMLFLFGNPICTRKRQIVIANSSVNSFNIIEDFFYHKVESIIHICYYKHLNINLTIYYTSCTPCTYAHDLQSQFEISAVNNNKNDEKVQLCHI